MHEVIAQLLARVEDLGMYRERTERLEAENHKLRSENERLRHVLEIDREVEAAMGIGRNV